MTEDVAVTLICERIHTFFISLGEKIEEVFNMAFMYKLSVVVGAEKAAVGSEHEGIAHMPGVVEALAIGLHDVFNLFFGFYMMCEGVKLAALLAVEAFGWG